MNENLDSGFLWHCLWSTKYCTDGGLSANCGIPSKRGVSEIAGGAGKIERKASHVEVIMRDGNAEDTVTCNKINRYGDIGAMLRCDSSEEAGDDQNQLVHNDE